MHRSTTSLQTWLLAIYLISINKNSISSLELERILGVTHKTAWRMGKQIRSSMKQNTRLLTGIVEADEAYIGGRRRSSNRYSNKIPLLGVVERGGEVRVQVTDRASALRQCHSYTRTLPKTPYFIRMKVEYIIVPREHLRTIPLSMVRMSLFVVITSLTR
jgi:hypothetical protein